MSVTSGGVPPDIETTPSRRRNGADSDMELDSPRNPSLIAENNGNSSGSAQRSRNSYKYSRHDVGPYQVYIENINSDFKGKLNALKVGEIILSNWPILDNKIKSIDSVGKSRVRVHFKDLNSANYLVDQNESDILKKLNLEAYIPKFMIFRQGVIRGIPTDYTEQYLYSKIKQVDHHCKFEVEQVKRINRKVTSEDGQNIYIPTGTCIVTFRSQALPKYVEINKVLAKVETYVQKVLLCYNCYRYGHLGKQCQSKPRCNNCGEEHVTRECHNDTVYKCFNCKGNHLTSNLQNCSEFNRQKQIKLAMSELNISYNDATKKFPRNSYANVAANQGIPLNQNTHNTTTVQESNNLQHTNINSITRTPNKVHNKYTFTKSIHPTKRTRESSPDPSLALRNAIIAPINIPSTSGGIVGHSSYIENINSSSNLCPAQDSLTNIILELVTHIVKNIKENNNYEIQQTVLKNLIMERLKSNESVNSQH